MDLGLRGRVAFVAASSKGMGRATAEQFAAEGADVGMCARSDPALQAAAESVRTHGVRVVATQADVSDPEQTKLAVERTVAELGRLDALVVNAGGPPRATFDELNDDRWEAAHQLTFMSAIHLVRAALPALRRSDSAAILFISSTSVKPLSRLRFIMRLYCTVTVTEGAATLIGCCFESFKFTSVTVIEPVPFPIAMKVN